MNILDKIKTAAKQKGLPLYEVEKRAGLAAGCISRWNEVSPRLENVKKVADVVGIDMNTLTQEDA